MLKHLILILAIIGLFSLPASAQTWTLRHGQTWDSYCADALFSQANRGFVARSLYRQYRERMEVVNQLRIDQGLPPMEIKTYRQWLKNK